MTDGENSTKSLKPVVVLRKQEAANAHGTGKLAANRRRGMILSVIVGSIIAHLVILVLFGLWTVARYWKEPQAVFEMKKVVKIPPRIPEQKMNLLKHEAMAPRPVLNNNLASMRSIDFALPDIPEMEDDMLEPLDPSDLLSGQISALLGRSGSLGALGKGVLGSGGKGDNGALTFFGMKAEGERIILLFDVSSSVVNKASSAGIPLQRIKSETLKLIDELPLSSRFSMIQFTQNYKVFRPELIAASDGAKKEARQWVEHEWVESGTMSGRNVVSNPRGLAGVIEEAFRMKPDLVFLISDASFQWRVDGGIRDIPYDELKKQLVKSQSQLVQPAAVHFIGFESKPEDEKEWKRLIRRSGGKFQLMRSGR